jgi:hypothetical protein
MGSIAAAATRRQDRDKPRLVELCPIGMPVLTQKKRWRSIDVDDRSRPSEQRRVQTIVQQFRV